MPRLPNQSVLSRFFAGLTALSLTVILTGCSNDDDAELGETVDASEVDSAEYVPASADGPAQNVPEPNLPAVATENTEEGAEASFQYFWEAEEFARLTGDGSAIALVSSDACGFCLESIDGWESSYKDGYWTDIQGELAAEITDIRIASDDGNETVAHVYFQLHEPATDFYDEEGNRTDGSFEAPDVRDWFALMEYDAVAQRWKIDWLGLEDSVDWEEE
ncbi:MAG TPA: hypothetical protein H9822_03665 [Candidatus Yaniella excrementavium]|nr:hypothetical protein [Candidatus Yaniella excrementavium]